MKKALFIFFIVISARLLQAQIPGCTDPLATNYNASATLNDGSCLYPGSNISPVSSYPLGNNLIETSGLTIFQNQLVTHNDSNDDNLYLLDSLDGTQYGIIDLNNFFGIHPTDWEEIQQDDNFIYLGDFGNNANGNRTNLRIYIVDKSIFTLPVYIIDSIYFTYSDQINFSPTGANNTDFDCEAFIVTGDSIFLLTKQWISNETALYGMPKTAGNHVAQKLAVLDVQGMITGASYIEDKRTVVMCGYNNLLQPFLYLLYDFQGSGFFDGNKRKLGLQLPFHQIESVASENGLNFYLTNERFTQSVITVGQQLHKLDLTSYLAGYYNTISAVTQVPGSDTELFLYPNPSAEQIFVQWNGKEELVNFYLYDMEGKTVVAGFLSRGNNSIETSGLAAGTYIFRCNSFNQVIITGR